MDVSVKIETLYEKVNRKEMSVTQAVHLIAEILQKNYRTFDSAKRDPDFQANVVLEFLRTGHRSFETIPQEKDFYSCVYSRIRGIIHTQIKKNADAGKISLVHIRNSENEYEEEQNKYQFTLIVEDKLSVPFAPENTKTFKLQPATLKEFMNKRTVHQEAKPAVISALRESYDISDKMVQMLCEKYNIDENDFFKNIQEIKEIQMDKYEKHQQYCCKRNATFFKHQRYSPDFADYDNASDSYKDIMQKRYESNTERWENHNEKIRNGKHHFTPSNDLLANKLDVCPRLISYYISKIRELSEKEAL